MILLDLMWGFLAFVLAVMGILLAAIVGYVVLWNLGVIQMIVLALFDMPLK